MAKKIPRQDQELFLRSLETLRIATLLMGGVARRNPSLESFGTQTNTKMFDKDVQEKLLTLTTEIDQIMEEIENG